MIENELAKTEIKLNLGKLDTQMQFKKVEIELVKTNDLEVGMDVDSIAIDMLNVRVTKVTMKQYERIKKMIEDNFQYKSYYSFGNSDYKYNINIQVGIGSEGGIYVAYRHNAAKESKQQMYDMKIEFNPSKATKVTEVFFKELCQILNNQNSFKVISCDIAVDVPYPINEIYSINTSGREYSNVRGTRYYGTSQKDNYLKIYDKVKERKDKGMEIPASSHPKGHLTRLELTRRFKNGKGMSLESLYHFKHDKIDEKYSIGSLRNIKHIYLKMIIDSIMNPNNGYSIKSIPQRDRDVFEKLLDTVPHKLEFEKLLNSKWPELLKTIERWFVGVSTQQEEDLVVCGDISDLEWEVNSKTNKTRLEHYEELNDAAIGRQEIENRKAMFEIDRQIKGLIEAKEMLYSQVFDNEISEKDIKKSLHSLATE